MPIYSFICRACHAEFESLMKPYEPVACKYCRHTGCERIPTSPSSFYVIKGDNAASTKPKAK